MDFAAVYGPLRQAHVGLVIVSVTLFVLRGLGVLRGHRWPMATWARRGSAAVDTLLLTAGVALWVGLGLNPAVHRWLGVKLALLPVYIVLGSLALKRARTRPARATALAAALLTVAVMAGIATSHDPALGWR